MMQASAVAAEVKSEIFIHARQTKMLIWAELNRGGCVQSNGQLTLRSDGTGVWTCSTVSANAHAADVWHVNFSIVDRTGTTIFGLGPFYSPCMNGGLVEEEYCWSAKFNFSAEMFSLIHTGVENFGCLPPAHALRQAGPAEVEVADSWCRERIAVMMGGAYA